MSRISYPDKSRACWFGAHSKCHSKHCGCFCHRFGIRTSIHTKRENFKGKRFEENWYKF